MRGHLHQPEIDALATQVLTVSDPLSYRHLDECELCLRRLIDEVLRLASRETESEAHAVAAGC
jgi:hypothetical protein